MSRRISLILLAEILHRKKRKDCLGVCLENQTRILFHRSQFQDQNEILIIKY